jgi:hypothetical protein
MSSPSGKNEGCRVLEDFVCEALPGPGIPVGIPLGRGAKVSVQMLSEFAVNVAQLPLTDERKAELRKLTTAQLLVLVQSNGAKLSPEELRFLHDLSLERLTTNAECVAQGADLLSREIMQAAVNRLA